MPIVIQSRGLDEAEWRSEVWRRSRDEAYAAARTKARLTGRLYRLVDHNGVVLEEVRRPARRARPGGA